MDLAQDFFALFGLPRGFALDAELLDERYRELQARIHPDKFAHAGDAEQRRAMQQATHANEAWQTLKSPLARARYLLRLAGHDPQIERNTAMPADFLVQQMEWREAVEEARADGDADGLDAMHRRLKKEIAAQHEELRRALDEQHDYARAAALVRQLMFQEKLLTEIDAALEAVEA